MRLGILGINSAMNCYAQRAETYGAIKIFFTEVRLAKNLFILVCIGPAGQVSKRL